jgi:hypothetical protein
MASDPTDPVKLILGLFTTDENAARVQANLDAALAPLDRSTVSVMTFRIQDMPEVAEIAQIIATPTLIRYWPRPRLRIVGDLSATNEVRKVLLNASAKEEDVAVIHAEQLAAGVEARLMEAAQQLAVREIYLDERERFLERREHNAEQLQHNRKTAQDSA